MNGDQSVRELTRRVLASVAPEELVLVDSYEPLAGDFGKTGRGPMAFGIEATAILVMPIVYKFFEALLNEVAKQSASTALAKVKQLFKQRYSADKPAALEFVKGELRSGGLSGDKLDKTSTAILEIVDL